jgi:serine/threonine protein kinase
MGCGQSDSSEDHFRRSYELGHTLGTGTFGDIKVARRSNCDAEYAVKFIDTYTTDASSASAAAVIEAQGIVNPAKLEVMMWKRVSGKENIVMLHEVINERRICHAVMEKCSGGTLLARLDKLRQGVLAEIGHICKGMASGIQAVHKAGIAHCDIKPSNFLFGGHDGNVVKLCDFGSASFLPANGEMLRGLFGTLPYMSPEMVNDKGFGKRTDLWSLGVTVYLMIFGNFPYLGPAGERAEQDILNAIQTGVPEPKFEPAVRENIHQDRLYFIATGFVHSLLMRDPSWRGTAHQALEHPFLNVESVATPRQQSWRPEDHPRLHPVVTVTPMPEDKQQILKDEELHGLQVVVTSDVEELCRRSKQNGRCRLKV